MTFVAKNCRVHGGVAKTCRFQGLRKGSRFSMSLCVGGVAFVTFDVCQEECCVHGHCGAKVAPSMEETMLLHSTFYPPHLAFNLSLNFALHILHSTFHILHFALCSPNVQFTLYNPLVTFHTLHFTLLRFTVHIPHPTLHILHFALYTLHSMFDTFCTLHLIVAALTCVSFTWFAFGFVDFSFFFFPLLNFITNFHMWWYRVVRLLLVLALPQLQWPQAWTCHGQQQLM